MDYKLGKEQLYIGGALQLQAGLYESTATAERPRVGFMQTQSA